MRRVRPAHAVLAAALLATGGCAYFNTLYNARLKYDEAVEIKRKSDPERLEISTQEEQLYKEAFERAARVVKYWPESEWVDDALLLMGQASLEKGDYSTALRKFDEVLTLYPDSDLRQETLFLKGRTLIATKDLGDAVVTLNRAAELGGDRWRGDILHHLGLVRAEQGDKEGALAAFSEVVQKHRESEWYARSGLEAGRLERESGDLPASLEYYEKVQHGGHTAEEQFLGGMRKGEVFLEMGDLRRARKTFGEVARRAANEERRGEARLEEVRAVIAEGDMVRAESMYRAILTEFPRKQAAAEARYGLGKLKDDAGDLAAARTEYESVKEEGTGHEAWQRASARATEIQRVLDLRESVTGTGTERDKSRFLLAEHLLEQIGDVDGALAEYTTLADEGRGTEWGAKALYAKAWVLENRLDRKADADSVMFQLANGYSGTDVDAVARRRLGFPVWEVQKVEPPRIVYVRPESESSEVTEVVLERVEPREVPLPQGVSEVKVWVRVGLGRDGSVEDTKVVKSGGAEFDTSCLEAARASRFLAPQDGGTDLTVVQYVFPRAKDPSAGGRGPTAPNTSPPGAGTGPPESSPQGFPSPGAPGEDLPRSGTPPDSLLNAVPPGTVGNPVSPPEAEQPPSLRDRPIERNP